MTGSQIALTDRPDLGAALKRAGDSEIVHAAAEAVIEGLGVDEIVLEAAATKASGVDGAAFVTNRRILVTADKKDPSHFEFLELDNLGNVTVLPYKGGWAVVASSTTHIRCGAFHRKSCETCAICRPVGPDRRPRGTNGGLACSVVDGAF